MKRNDRWLRLAALMILILIFGAVLPGNVQAAEVRNEKEEKEETEAEVPKEEYSAKLMRLLHYEGQVELEDASGNSAFMMENIRLSSGQALKTGPAGSASVGLDASRIVTLDAESRVEFIQEEDRMELHLMQGALFLDVQDKLDENEVLDIRTSTMAVGIRGTIVYVSVEEEGAEIPGAVTLGVLEGTARIKYLDESGTEQFAAASAGQKVTAVPIDKEGIPGLTPGESGNGLLEESDIEKRSLLNISKLEQTDLTEFVDKKIREDTETRIRVSTASSLLRDASSGEENQYPAGGDWTWNNRVELVAQSASKLYDGQPLTRPSDVLVYGLPEIFSIRTYASGSQTDAGTGVNSIAAYTIYNAAGEDVTRHFTNVIKTSGSLVVDPAPVTIWTDSAEKVYDGQPLTAEDAGVRFVPGYTKEQVSWRNRSYLITDKDGISYNKQVLYGLCGATAAHASNPYTGETRDILLNAGERLTVHLHEEDESGSTIDFIVEKITEEEVPEDILRLYADNPALLEQACQDTDWDIEILQKRIGELPPDEERKTVEQDGLQVDEKGAERLMTELTNVRLTVDTRITSYYDRALGSMEAHFTPVRIDDDIKVKATGSQTDVGESVNTYEIDWGRAKPSNYIISEDLGTLTVTPAPLSVTTESAQKPYDGTPLTWAAAELTGLVEGETASVTGTGSITRVGSADNTYRIDWGSAKEGNYAVTEETLGTLTVTPAGQTLTITTASASKTYDGRALTSSEATVSGLIGGDTITVTPTGSITDAGSAENTYEIEWGDTDPQNYKISETLGTLTVEPAGLSVTTGSAEKTYDGRALTSSEVTVSGLQGEETITVTPTGSITDAGTGENTYTIAWDGAKESNYKVSGNPGTLTVSPAALTVTTGSAEKTYDGSALTSSEVTVSGLQGEDSITVTPTGSITDAGSTENTCTINWGRTKSSNYTLTKNLGTLTVNHAGKDLIITTGSAEKTYDGSPLENSEVTVTGLIGGDIITVKASGSITDAGTAQNTYTIDWGGTDPKNYTVVESLGTLTVDRADLTVTTGSAEKTYDGEALSSSEVTITGLAEGETITVTPTGSITDAGSAKNSYTISWTGADQENYILKEEPGTLTVNKADLTVKTGSAEKTYDGSALESSEVTITGLAEGETITVTPTGSITQAGSAKNTCTIEWGTAKESNYNLTTKPGTLTVNHADKELTITTGSAQKTYDGSPLTDSEVTVSGLIGSDTVTVTATGTITDAGSAQNAYIIDWGGTDPGNYTVVESLGTLTVDPADLTVKTGSAEKTYDGEALSSSEVTITGLAEGETITVTPTGSITQAGSAKNTCTIEWGTAKESNYNLTTEPGTLKVNHANKELTITTGSAEKTYDGSPLTDSEVTVTGLIGSDTVTVTATGTITDAGSAQNTYTIDWGGTDPENYTVIGSPGTLTVKPAELTVSTGSETKNYDGEALTCGEVNVTGLADGETVTVTASGSITDAGETDNTYTIDWGSAKESNYSVTDDLGTLKVTPLPVTIDLNAPETLDSIRAWVPWGPKASWPGTEEAPAQNLVIGGDMSGVGYLTCSFTLPGGKVDMRVPAVSGEGVHTLEPVLNFTEGKESNYDITYVNDTVEMIKVELIVDMNCSDAGYDGDYHLPEGITARYGDGTEAEVEEGDFYEEDGVLCREFLLHLKTDTMTMQVRGVRDAGEYTVEPCEYWSEEEVYISCTNNTMTIDPLPVTIDLKASEVLDTIKDWVPEGVTASWQGSSHAAKEEYTEGSPGDDGYCLVDKFELPGGVLTVKTPSVSGRGSHQLEPELTMESGDKSNYEFSYVHDTVQLGDSLTDLYIDMNCYEGYYNGDYFIPEGITASYSDGTVVEAVESPVYEDDTVVGVTAEFSLRTGTMVFLIHGQKDAGTYTIEPENIAVTGEPSSFILINNTMVIHETPLVFDLNLEDRKGTIGNSITLDKNGKRCLYGRSEKEYLPADVYYINDALDEEPHILVIIFKLPSDVVTLRIMPCTYRTQGTYTVKPELIFEKGGASNYDISYINNTFKAEWPSTMMSGMKTLTAGVRAIAGSLPEETAAIAGTETKETGEKAGSSKAEGEAALKDPEEEGEVPPDADGPDQDGRDQDTSDQAVQLPEETDPVSQEGEAEQAEEEDGEEKKSSGPEEPEAQAPAPAESGKDEKEKTVPPEEPADSSPAPEPALAPAGQAEADPEE